MNYRHAYHAGNFADVVKHVVLSLCLEHLKKKPAPFRVIDSHAGAGLYDLASEAALKTGEWREGVGRVLAALPGAPPQVVELLSRWRDGLRSRQPSGEIMDRLRLYPGSPVFAADQLRAGDTLYAVERHPEERKRLAALFKADRRVKVPDLDGWVAIRSLLPPAERRVLVLVDPPFEEPGEFQRLASALDEGLTRFRPALFLLWYPIKDPKPVERFRRSIGDIVVSHRIEAAIDIELLRRAPRHPDVLSGAGLIVVNPPYLLSEQMGHLLPWLGQTLAETAEASSAVRRIGR